MAAGLWCLVGILACITVFCLIKIYFLRKSAREIQEGFTERLITETNTLLTISGHDSRMRALADTVNQELRLLRRERHRFQQGDLEMKEAVTNISHDLRTPLTAVCGYLELLKQEEKPEKAARYVAIIEERAEAMKQLTEELFRYSVITVADRDFCCEEVILNQILEESISAYYAALKGRGITPVISIPEEKVSRRLDRRALCRILENIISNAIRYSDGDLNIRLSGNGEIVFSNHASGLDPVQAGRLFNRFYTVESAKKGTGLGLSIAKLLTEQMGGMISADYDKSVINIRLHFPATDSKNGKIEKI